MADLKDAHIVEIPVDEEHQQKQNTISISVAMQHHPLTEISQSPGHLLLLKLWQREEDLFSKRISLKETRLDSIRRELFHLLCFFFLFHGLFTTLLFTSSLNPSLQTHNVCKNWWIPCLISVSNSVVLVLLVQVKLWRYWKVSGEMERERVENRALVRCVQELRMKGKSFDLSKGVMSGGGKRLKSSSVEIKWRAVTWWKQNLLTVCLLCFAGLVSFASKLILCF